MRRSSRINDYSPPARPAELEAWSQRATMPEGAVLANRLIPQVSTAQSFSLCVSVEVNISAKSSSKIFATAALPDGFK